MLPTRMIAFANQGFMAGKNTLSAPLHSTDSSAERHSSLAGPAQ
jgi:hypothetical protein